MIQKYKKISIIYGASGIDCAKEIDKQLKKLHLEEFYPIKSYILAKEIMSSASILTTVKDIISSSSACIIILTFDDVNNTRVRQNVLIEIGMALTLIEKEHCFFISETKTLPEDFPSDLKGIINPNYFDKNNLTSVAVQLCDEIKEHLHIKNYKNILQDDKYVYDYKKVLDDIPVHIFEEKADIQLGHILDQWEANIESFEFVAERIMYLIERIKFFPDFNCNDRFFSFLSRIKELIRPTERDYDTLGIEYLNYICNFVNKLLTYTEIKLNREVLRCLDNPAGNPDYAIRCKYLFQDIAEELKEFVVLVEKNDVEFHYNWLIQIMAYEYAALAEMKVMAFEESSKEKTLDKLDFVINCYEKMMELGKRKDAYSKILWMGYAQYDLTRAYESLYNITKDTKYLDNVRENSNKSIVTRRQWFQDNNFKGVFSSALSYEYFLVNKYEYELRYKIKEYSSDMTEDIISGLGKVRIELAQYCESTELGRLYDMRDSIVDLINTISTEK